MNWRVIRPLIAASIAAALLLGVAASPLVAPLSAQGLDYIPGPIIEDPPSPFTGESYVGPPENFVLGQTGALLPVVITYNGFTAPAQAAFQAAVDIWASQLQSSVPIRITANWTSLEANVLGSAGPTYLFRNFSGALFPNTYFAAASAKAISGTDLTAGLSPNSDITANFNSSFDWYLGTDGNAGSKYDLMTVVLHELGHGLGFFGSMTVTGVNGSWGLNGSPVVYDKWAINGSLQSLLDTTLFPNPSTALQAQLVSNNVYYNGANGRAANSGAAPRLYAPATWQQGSSYSHLDEATYPQGNVNSLMTPQLGPGEVIHDPGPIVRGVFKDSGWPAVTNRVSPTDFDGDGKSDVTIYRPSTGVWYVLRSGSSYAAYSAYAWGISSDLPVRGDFDGDGRADVAVYRPSSGVWYILQSSTGYSAYSAYQWGTSGDIPVPGDYDHDGKTDIAVYRPSSGVWYILNSSTGYSAYSAYQFGTSDDVPVTGDFDGDGRADVAVYRPSNGVWYILQSSTGYSAYSAYQWGTSGDLPVPGDYDGDGQTDVAVYRPSSGVWYILQSSTGYSAYSAYQWGTSGDIPVPGDYDGDGQSEVAMYRPSSGVWYLLRSSTGYSATAYSAYQWGTAGDVPVPKQP